MVVARYLVMDTSSWLLHYGLGPAATVAAVRAIASTLQRHGYTLAYTSVTTREVRKSPRREVKRLRDEILRHIRSHGVRVGPGYWELIGKAEALGVPNAKIDDAAIVIAASENNRLWFGSDSWAACFALQRGVNAIYIHPNL